VLARRVKSNYDGKPTLTRVYRFITCSLRIFYDNRHMRGPTRLVHVNRWRTIERPCRGVSDEYSISDRGPRFSRVSVGSTAWLVTSFWGGDGPGEESSSYYVVHASIPCTRSGGMLHQAVGTLRLREVPAPDHRPGRGGWEIYGSAIPGQRTSVSEFNPGPDSSVGIEGV